MSEQIQKNIRIRKSAEFIIDFMEQDEYANETRFWNILGEHIASKLGKVLADSNEMSEVQALAFSNSLMPYGKYQALPLNVIMNEDREYLPWIAENMFSVDLKKWLRSKWFKNTYLKDV